MDEAPTGDGYTRANFHDPHTCWSNLSALFYNLAVSQPCDLPRTTHLKLTLGSELSDPSMPVPRAARFGLHGRIVHSKATGKTLQPRLRLLQFARGDMCASCTSCI
jgi:hypothetical protein